MYAALRLLVDPDAMRAAGFQSTNAVHVYGEPRTLDQESVMAEEVVSLWLHVVAEYAFTFMQYEYGYPLRFASLLFNDAAFPLKKLVCVTPLC